MAASVVGSSDLGDSVVGLIFALLFAIGDDSALLNLLLVKFLVGFPLLQGSIILPARIIIVVII